MASKALTVSAYHAKLVELTRHPDIDLTCVVPPAWAGRRRETVEPRGYRLIEQPIRFDGNHHLFHWVGLPRLIQSSRPHILHIDEEPYDLATFLATRAARTAGSRVVFFTWQNLLKRLPPPFRQMERYVYASASAAIAGSSEAVSVLARKGYRGPTIVLPQFGVDPETFRPRGPHTSASFEIGYVGRLVPEKGVDLLLQAAATLSGEWRLTVLGDGPERQRLVALADRLGVARRVTWQPAVASSDVPSQMAALDVFVLPSLTRPNWKEQFGRVLVEAMASGVPPVGSTCGEIPSVIGDAGLLFAEGDVAGLAGALTRLQRDPGLRSSLAARGRKRVLSLFTHARIASETVDLYRSVAAR
ncbi:MAG: glycosyltransferase [Chloroflexota bacterium]